MTPVLIAAASLLGRRFGQSVAGWLVGFPFTSGPVSLFLALDHGPNFAASAAVGSIASVAAQAAFAVAYVRSPKRGAAPAVLLGTVAFALAAGATAQLGVSLAAVVAVAVTGLVAALALLPARHARPATREAAPRWDLPARMLVATALVLAITSGASLLGPLTTGLVSGFPLYATVLAVFAERAGGRADAAEVMRGLVVGLFGFGTFFVVIALALGPIGVAGAFILALVAIGVVQSISLVVMARARGAAGPPHRFDISATQQ